MLNEITYKNKRNLGFRIEQLAAEYLTTQGLRILHKNFQCRLGEIDIIAQQQNTLIFIEVRYRRSVKYGTPAESILYRKQKKIIQVAKFFLMQHTKFAKFPCRFDVIAVTIEDKQAKIDWIKHAFY